MVLGDSNADDVGSAESGDAIHLTLVCRSFLIRPPFTDTLNDIYAPASLQDEIMQKSVRHAH